MRARIDALLLGAGGPIGTATARTLEARGARVLSTSRRGRGANRLDVSVPDDVRRVLAAERPRALVYLVTPRAGEAETVDVIRSAVSDLRTVVELAGRAGVERFVFTSSGAVYGDRGESSFLESSPTAGESPYARLKTVSERTAVDAAREGLHVVNARIFNVYGPGCELSLVNRLISGDAPRLYLSDRFVRDYVHVDDVAGALAIAALEDVPAGTVNVGTGVATDNLELSRLAAPGSFIGIDERVVSWSVADVARAYEALGWRATRELRDAFRS